MAHTPSADPTPRTLLHLHAAAQFLFPQSRAISSHLVNSLLTSAEENEVNLPKVFIETRFCQRCGTPYLPGFTCTVRNGQSRRQKRKARNFSWVVYKCNVCNGEFRTEAETDQAEARIGLGGVRPRPPPVEKASTLNPAPTSSKRKRDRMQGLKKAIEKSKEEKPDLQLSLLDLMKVD